MASPAPVTRASGGDGKGGGGGKKIMGIDRTTFFVVGGGALGLGLLYFYMQGKKTQGQGSGQGKKQQPHSPTGLHRQHIVIWLRDHQGGHHGR